MKKLFTTAAVVAAVSMGSAFASSHREAPFLTKNPKVDGTDLYLFNSYETGRANYVTVLANYIPLQDAYGGPNFFSMDPEALYEIHFDNTGDGREDISFQFRFTNALVATDGFKLAIGPPDGGASQMVSIPLINFGPIGLADGGFTTANQNLTESYSLSVARGGRRTAATALSHAGGAVFGKPVDNIGTKSFPGGSYDNYAKSFMYTTPITGGNAACTANPARVFVGQRKEGFAVNLGVIFDLVNAPAGVIIDPTARAAGGAGSTAFKNVTTIAMEIHADCLKGAGTTVGAWTTASVRQARVINPSATYVRPSREGGAWTQVSRLGMPLVNEVVIGLKDKDKFNTSEPKDDAMNFAPYVTNPTLPVLLQILFGAAGVSAPTAYPRTDLIAAFLTGVTNVNFLSSGTPPNNALTEMIRLNTGIPATAAASQNDLGAAGCFTGDPPVLNPGAASCDPAGFPNGRRPGDDVVDITLRVAMGYLLPSTVAPNRAIPFHDAVLQNQSQFDVVFPYLKTPLPGAP